MENHLLPRSVSNGRCEKVHFARLWNTDANKTQTRKGKMIMMVGMVDGGDGDGDGGGVDDGAGDCCIDYHHRHFQALNQLAR